MLRATWSGFCAFRPPLPSARQAGRIEIEIRRVPTDQDRSERSQNRPPEPIKAAQPLGLRCARIT